VIDSTTVKRIGVLYHPKVQKTEAFARTISDHFSGKGLECWLLSSWDEAAAKSSVKGSDLILSVGGDGTILRVARIVFPLEIPIVGVNFGNLGFMTELEADEVLDKLPLILAGQGRIESRAMLQSMVKSTGKTYYALNDIVIGRGKNVRLVNIEVKINGDLLATYRADAVIVSTATGSTGYALAANGPILFPESRDIILKAVCPHLSLDKAVVLKSDTEIKLTAFTNHEAVISMDGQVEESLQNGEEITVTLSPKVTRFVRLKPEGNFYNTLTSKLKGKSI
jgi:NAD+ kinase